MITRAYQSGVRAALEKFALEPATNAYNGRMLGTVSSSVGRRTAIGNAFRANAELGATSNMADPAARNPGFAVRNTGSSFSGGFATDTGGNTALKMGQFNINMYPKAKPGPREIPGDNGGGTIVGTNFSDKASPTERISKAFNDIKTIRNHDVLNEGNQMAFGGPRA